MGIHSGGHSTRGSAVGILMLDTQFPRIPGTIGNAATFRFPVSYRVVGGASARRVVVQSDPELLEPFISAARELERTGVRLISTSCGFLAIFQREMARALRVPIISSSLLQVPMVSRMVGGRPVGILTARRSSLTERHFKGAGWSSWETPVVVRGMDEAPLFSRAAQENLLTLDFDRLRGETVDVARQMVEERPDVAAIVLECTTMPPYAASIQEAVDRPVFSIVTLINMVYSAMEQAGLAGQS